MSNVVLESSRGLQLVPLKDELLRSRQIFLEGEVNAESCGDIIKQLLYLDQEDSTKEITIYINSPGGSVTDGLALYDTIMLMRSPIRTVCTGLCASMGAIIFLAGKKREMMNHGKIMIHDPAFGGKHEMGGKKPHEIQTELDDLNKVRESLAKLIAERTRKNIEEIYKVTADDTYYSPKEAIAFGLATGIITRKGGIGIGKEK